MNYPQGFSGGAMPSMGGSSGRGSKFFTTSKKGKHAFCLLPLCDRVVVILDRCIKINFDPQAKYMS
jgi:hypothetical protein